MARGVREGMCHAAHILKEFQLCVFRLSGHRTLGGPGEGECVRGMTLPCLDD